MSNETRQCVAMCGLTKPVSEFPRGRKICSVCTTILRRERYRDEMEDKQREMNRQFFKTISWPPPAQLQERKHG